MCRFRLATEVEQVVPGDDYSLANLRGVCWRCSRRERTDLGSSSRRRGDAGQDPTQQFADLPDEPPEGQGLVVVIRGPSACGYQFLLDSDVNTAGRHPDASVFLNHSTVSRAHAEFFRPADSWRFQIRDLGSTNGTYVNHERVEQATLTRGDEIRIGSFELVFLAEA